MDNPILMKTVKTETGLKEMLVNYVGSVAEPENNEVTVEMIVNVMSSEFPEFLMVVAEENWIRGYKQGLDDAHGHPRDED